jgi:hypothetical protein
MRDWVQKVLSSSGRERLTKNDLDYWLGSRQILKAATTRIRALKPLIELLAVLNPLAESAWLGRFLHRSQKLNWERCGRHCRDGGELCRPGLYPGHQAIQFGSAPAAEFFKLNKKHSAELG